MISRIAARAVPTIIFQFVADDAHIVQMQNNEFCSIRGMAGACSRRFEFIKINRLIKHLTIYSPLANRFVEDAKPYGFFVSRAYFPERRGRRSLRRNCVDIESFHAGERSSPLRLCRWFLLFSRKNCIFSLAPS